MPGGISRKLRKQLERISFQQEVIRVEEEIMEKTLVLASAFESLPMYFDVHGFVSTHEGGPFWETNKHGIVKLHYGTAMMGLKEFLQANQNFLRRQSSIEVQKRNLLRMSLGIEISVNTRAEQLFVAVRQDVENTLAKWTYQLNLVLKEVEIANSHGDNLSIKKFLSYFSLLRIVVHVTELFAQSKKKVKYFERGSNFLIDLDRTKKMARHHMDSILRAQDLIKVIVRESKRLKLMIRDLENTWNVYMKPAKGKGGERQSFLSKRDADLFNTKDGVLKKASSVLEEHKTQTMESMKIFFKFAHICYQMRCPTPNTVDAASRYLSSGVKATMVEEIWDNPRLSLIRDEINDCLVWEKMRDEREFEEDLFCLSDLPDFEYKLNLKLTSMSTHLLTRLRFLQNVRKCKVLEELETESDTSSSTTESSSTEEIMKKSPYYGKIPTKLAVKSRLPVPKPAVTQKLVKKDDKKVKVCEPKNIPILGKGEQKVISVIEDENNNQMKCAGCTQILKPNEILDDDTIDTELSSLNIAITQCRTRIKNCKKIYESRQIDLVEINQVLDLEQKELDKRQKNIIKRKKFLEHKSLKLKALEDELISALLKKMKGRTANSHSLSTECIPDFLDSELVDKEFGIDGSSEEHEMDYEILLLQEEIRIASDKEWSWDPEIYGVKIEEIFQKYMNLMDLKENQKENISKSTSAPDIFYHKF